MMIDTMFIKAQRRAAKNTGDGQGNQRRRRHTQRSNDRPEGDAMAPTSRPPDNHDADPDFQRHPPSERQTRPAQLNSDAVTVLRRDNRSSQTATIVRPPPSIQPLQEGVANLTIRDETPTQPPKQGRNRGRNRGRSSKQGSPQRTFQARTSSEDQRAGMAHVSTGSPIEVGRSVGSGDAQRKGLLQISTQPLSSTRNQDNMPVIRLPSTDFNWLPPFNGSQGSVNAIPSEDTNFGSDISRGAVQEGRLYNHKQVDKQSTTKAREHQKVSTRQVEDNSPPRAQRGVLRIQPTNPEKAEQPKKESGHRGGLLFIDRTAIKPTSIKPTSNNNKPTRPRGKNNQSSEFQRNAVPLRKEQEPHPHTRRDNLPDLSEQDTILRDGPKSVMTTEELLHEVKTAYQEIQNLERKIETIYESQDDTMEIPRMQTRPHSDGVSWSTYSQTHKELLEFYHTFFIMTQHPSAPSSVRRLPKKHDVLARYWKYGIIYLLEYLRHRLPLSQSHMESFIFGAYSLTSVLLQDVPAFQSVWMECLGDLARYLYGIEENDADNKEHWKTVAREWYLKTINVNNGTEGRLFHHIGILSKDDHFVQLYYYSKSLMVGFSGAREAFLILIDPILGSSASSWSDAFVRLNGMLFARLQLDSFDDEVDVFLDHWGEPPATNLQWAMLAVTNIAALYQYNRKDSRLKDALRQGRREKRENEADETAHVEEQGEGDAILPPSQLRGGLEFNTNNIDHGPKDTFRNMPVDIQSDNSEDVPLSNIVFEKACHLASVFLSEILNSGPGEDGPLIAVHIWLVFLTYALRYQPVVRLLERKLPWQELGDFLNDVMALDENTRSVAAVEAPSGPVLLEDSVMQGFEWSKKSLPKNWFQNIDPLEEIEESAESSASRIKRIVSLSTQLNKICDCLELTEPGPHFQVSEALATRIAAAKALEEEEAERLEAVQAARETAMDEPADEENPMQAESDEDTYVPGESEEIRMLKTRRRELKALLREQRPDPKTVLVADSTKKGTVRKAIKAGYTILVFDTNLLISHLDILQQVVEAGEWQIVVPLLVINELDGLKVNAAPLGPAATAAFNFVEQSLLARKLRVVTQEGTGLSNLSLRSQQLLSRNTEDGERSSDSFIISFVNDQIQRHTGKIPSVEKAVLITGDRNMRVIAKARGIQSMSVAELRKELPKKGDMVTESSPKKKAWS